MHYVDAMFMRVIERYEAYARRRKRAGAQRYADCLPGAAR